MTQKTMSYKEAGVDIQAGQDFVDILAPLANASRRKGCMSAIGGFGAVFDPKASGYEDPLLVSTTDGVGTKLHIAVHMNKHHPIGVDLVATCANDLIAQGAEPMYFLDYYSVGALDVARGKEIIEGIIDGCAQAGCALVGGETAEMPGLYKEKDYDVAGFSVGMVERNALLPKNTIKEGDILLGLASSGVHSNGFSLVRHIIKERNFNYNDTAPFDGTMSLGEALLRPTRIYVKSCLSLTQQGKIKGLAHISGGGMTDNIPRILQGHLAASIDGTSWQVPAVFSWLKKEGNVEEEEMIRTFNCGIGMVCIVDLENESEVKAALEAKGERVYNIGKVVAKTKDAVEWSRPIAW